MLVFDGDVPLFVGDLMVEVAAHLLCRKLPDWEVEDAAAYLALRGA